MKLMRYLAALSAIVLAALSCSEIKEPVNQEEEKPPVPEIQLAVSEVELASDGAAVDVAYMIENPVEGKKISVSYDAEWLTVSTSKARILSFSADLNETGAVREAQVVLSYEGAEDVTVDVSQEFFVNPLEVSVADVTATSVKFSVTTSDPELTWIPMVTYKENFEYFDTDEELFQSDLEYFRYLADIQDMTLAEFLEMMTAAGSMVDVVLDGLQPSVDYVLYAYGVTAEGRRTTDIVYAPFTTESPYEGDITFTITAEELDYILNYSIVPSHTGVPYFYGIQPWTTLEEWKVKHGGNLRDAIQAEEIDSEVNELMELGMISGPDDYYIIYNESDVMDWGYWELKASTKYVIYACKWDDQCRLVGPVSTYEHTSQPVDASANEITLSVSNITQSSADATATVTLDDPFVVMPIRKSEIQGMTDDEIFAYVTTNYDYLVSEYIFTGNVSKTFTRMRPDTEYSIIAFGYKAGTLTNGEMDRVDFKTLPAGDPEDCTFEFKVTADVDYAFIEVTPSDKGQFYHWLVYPSYYTNQNAKDYVSKVIEASYEGDVETFSSWELSLGDDSANAWDLFPATEYKVGAVIMDYDTGEFLTDFVFSEPFTTLEKTYANITFNFEYGSYYDLGQLINAGQKQFEALLKDGDAIMPVKLTVKGNCSAYYYAIYTNYTGDITDEEEYPDELFHAGLEASGFTGESTNFIVKYDTHMTLMAMAYDYDGNMTKVYRAPLYFTQEGVSPAKDFIASMKKSQFMEARQLPLHTAAVASKSLQQGRLDAHQLQAKHDEAMAKVKEVRRERIMKEFFVQKTRKSKMIAR